MLRNRIVIISAALAILVVVSGIAWCGYEYLTVRDMNFYGTKHLTADDLRALMETRTGNRLFALSATEMYLKLKKSPWVKDAMVRKDLEGRIHVQITEAVPVALLSAEDKIFLVDRDGIRLEELGQGGTYFLPVIKSDPASAKEAYAEAVAFAGVLFDRKFNPQSGHIEISGSRPEELFMKYDNLTVKIGSGEFAKKLEKLAFVKEELVKRGLSVEYVDLRFSDKIVVKPLKGESSDMEGIGSVKENRKSGTEKRGRKGTGGRGRNNVG